jgi:hypothetical protein
MEDEKNDEIQNLHDQLYSQPMSTYPVTPYPSFPGQGYPKHSSPPSQRSLSVHPIGRSGFSTSHPVERDSCNDIKVLEIHSYSHGPEYPQTFPAKQTTIDLTASSDPSASAKEVPPPRTCRSPSPHPITSHSPPSRPKTLSPTPPSPTSRDPAEKGSTPRPIDETPPQPVDPAVSINQGPAADEQILCIQPETDIIGSKSIEGDVQVDSGHTGADVKVEKITNRQQRVENKIALSEEDGKEVDLSLAQQRSTAMKVARELKAAQKAKRNAKLVVNLRKDKSAVPTRFESSPETPAATAAQQVSMPFTLFNTINSRTDSPSTECSNMDFDLSFLDCHREDIFRNLSFDSDEDDKV